MGLRAGLDVFGEEKNFLTLPGIEPVIVQQVTALHWLVSIAGCLAFCPSRSISRGAQLL